MSRSLASSSGLLCLAAQEVEVLIERRRRRSWNPVAQTAQHRATLVVAEVMPRLALEHDADAVERAGELLVGQRRRAGGTAACAAVMIRPRALRDVARTF